MVGLKNANLYQFHPLNLGSTHDNILCNDNFQLHSIGIFINFYFLALADHTHTNLVAHKSSKIINILEHPIPIYYIILQ